MAEAAVWQAVGRLYPGVDAGDLTLADALASLARLRPALDRTTHSVVREARADGASWAEIGAVLGVSPQAAHQRFRTTASRSLQPPTRP